VQPLQTPVIAAITTRTAPSRTFVIEAKDLQPGGTVTLPLGNIGPDFNGFSNNGNSADNTCGSHARNGCPLEFREVEPSSRPAVAWKWLTNSFAGRTLVAGVLLKLAALALRVAVTGARVTSVLDTFGDLLIVIAALIIGYSSLFTVYQTQQALVIRLGQPVRVVNEPGLNVKAPFIDSVVYIDKRILDLEAPSQEVIASDQKRLVVDAFARYRIQEPLRFYQTLGSITGANSQLSILLNSALRRVLGEVTFTHVVRDQRADLMSRIRELVDREATAYGIQVVDVRIRRADLPEQNSQAVYQRMQTERQREAAEFRAQGAQRAQEIRSRADREVTVLVAEATSKSEQIRGEGDAIRNQIFADAFNQDQDFFAFYRSMQAYEHGLKSTDTRMLLKPDSSFFRYFSDPSGKARDRVAPSSGPAPAR